MLKLKPRAFNVKIEHLLIGVSQVFGPPFCRGDASLKVPKLKLLETHIQLDRRCQHSLA